MRALRDFNVAVGSCGVAFDDDVEVDVYADFGASRARLPYSTAYSDLHLSSRWPLAETTSARMRLGGAAIWARVQGPSCVVVVVHARVRDPTEYAELGSNVLGRAFADPCEMHLLVGQFGGLEKEEIPQALADLRVFQPPGVLSPNPRPDLRSPPLACVGVGGLRPVWCYTGDAGGGHTQTRSRWRSCRRRRARPHPGVLLGCKV